MVAESEHEVLLETIRKLRAERDDFRKLWETEKSRIGDLEKRVSELEAALRVVRALHEGRSASRED